MHPIGCANDRRRGDSLGRHSLLLLAAAQVGNASNLLFQWAMMRGLSDAEYGTTAALLSGALAISSAMEALRASVARQVAKLQAAALGRVVVRWALGLVAAAAVLAVAAAIWAEPVAEMFALGDPRRALLAAGLVGASLFMPLMAGALQGMQSFGWFAVSAQAFGVVRLMVGAALVFGVSATAGAALVGQGLGVAASVALGLVGWRIALARARAFAPTAVGADLAEDVRAEGGYFARALPALAAFGVLMSADAPVARLGLGPDAAGAFARAAMMARAVVFLPMPIALAVFPKIVSRTSEEAEIRSLRRRSGAYVAFLVVVSCLAAWWFGAPIWTVWTGRRPTTDEGRMLRALIVAMAPLGGVYLQINIHLAMGRWKSAWVVIPFALLYVLAVVVCRAKPLEIAVVLAICAWSALAALAAAGRRTRPSMTTTASDLRPAPGEPLAARARS